jgi:hypothetical protein
LTTGFLFVLIAPTIFDIVNRGSVGGAIGVGDADALACESDDWNRRHARESGHPSLGDSPLSRGLSGEIPLPFGRV